MPDPTLIDALRACAIIFPTGVLTVVGKTDGGSPVSVPLGDGATREVIVALTRSDDLTAVYRQRDEARAQRDELEARPLIEPHALEVAIRERDDARAHVDRLAYEVAANRRTIAGLTTKVEDERLAHGQTHRALAEAEKRATDAEAARERAFVTMDKIVKERNEAWARVRVLETSAEPSRWLRRDLNSGVFALYDHEPAISERYETIPLYIHPPKPTVDVTAIRKALATLRTVRIWTFEDMQRSAEAFTAIDLATREG